MKILNWLKRGRNKSKQSIDRVSFGYKPQTASRTEYKFLLNEDESKAYHQKEFRFIDYRIAGIRVVGLDEKDNGNVYEVYTSHSRATALEYLRAIPLSEFPPLYYVIVETPEGNLGKDLKGMFEESTGNSIN